MSAGSEQERTEARDLIQNQARFYLKSMYSAVGVSDSRYFEGLFRGFIHGLGFAGVIPRETECHITKIDFSEMKKRRAYVFVKQMLNDGFETIDSGQLPFLDEFLRVSNE